MNKKTSAIRIDRHDFDRALITEVLPYETPVIFDNESCYERIKSISTYPKIERRVLEAILLHEGDGISVPHSTIPYSYKIRKSSLSYRRLSLMHPASQWKVREFYEKYESLIIHYCSCSPVSIRAPYKVLSKYYVKNKLQNLHLYKSDSKSLGKDENLTKNSPSYFTYRYYDRLYKFFDSKDFMRLEKKYLHLKTLDVSKCFDSIYTHTMSWAIKNKGFTKRNVSVSATFAQAFDKLMQGLNHNETNGIVIGPEVSRIFAEIILQAIDIRAIHELNKIHLVLGCDYEIRRYVDDYYIFACSRDVAKKVYEIFADSLLTVNLHVNEGKSIDLTHPFITPKSKIIQSASRAVNDFVKSFLETNNEDQTIKPLKIHSPWKLTRSFIDVIKFICAEEQVNYDELSGYLIAIFSERVKRIVSIKGEDIDKKKYSDALLVILEIQFFLYQVSPSVSASYRFSASIILATRFADKYLNDDKNTLKHKMFECSTELFGNQAIINGSNVDKYVSLESLNILLAAKELGDDYLLSPGLLKDIMKSHKMSYFSIVSILYYIEDNSYYSELNKQVSEYLARQFRSLDDVLVNSEKANLLLDILSCPYVKVKKRKLWLLRVCKCLKIPVLHGSDVSGSLQSFLDHHWFVNWPEIDLLNSLEKKELKKVY